MGILRRSELLKVLRRRGAATLLVTRPAYRDTEVEPSHPLFRLFEEVAASAPRSRGSRWDRSLSVGASVAHARPVGGAFAGEPLVGRAYRKTHGNPFFLGQLLLGALPAEAGAARLDDGAWQWDQERWSAPRSPTTWSS